MKIEGILSCWDCLLLLSGVVAAAASSVGTGGTIGAMGAGAAFFAAAIGAGGGARGALITFGIAPDAALVFFLRFFLGLIAEFGIEVAAVDVGIRGT